MQRDVLSARPATDIPAFERAYTSTEASYKTDVAQKHYCNEWKHLQARELGAIVPMKAYVDGVGGGLWRSYGPLADERSLNGVSRHDFHTSTTRPM